MTETDEAKLKRVCKENPDLPEDMVRNLLDWKQREIEGLNEEPVRSMEEYRAINIADYDLIDRLFPNNETEDF